MFEISLSDFIYFQLYTSYIYCYLIKIDNYFTFWQKKPLPLTNSIYLYQFFNFRFYKKLLFLFVSDSEKKTFTINCVIAGVIIDIVYFMGFSPSTTKFRQSQSQSLLQWLSLLSNFFCVQNIFLCLALSLLANRWMFVYDFIQNEAKFLTGWSEVNPLIHG